MKTLLTIIITTTTLFIYAQQPSFNIIQYEIHIGTEDTYQYGLIHNEFHFDKTPFGIWQQTIVTEGWGYGVVGGLWQKPISNKLYLDTGLAIGYEYQLPRPRFVGYVFGKYTFPNKRNLKIFYQSGYGNNYWNLGVVLYDLTNWLSIGAMTQTDGITGPRAQLRLKKDILQPWIGYQVLDPYDNAMRLSIGLRSEF